MRIYGSARGVTAHTVSDNINQFNSVMLQKNKKKYFYFVFKIFKFFKFLFCFLDF